MSISSLGNNFACFLAVFYATIVCESMTGTFLNSAIQSLERQFQISSSKSGLLISASRFGTVPTVLILAYLGNKGNKARWIGLSCILIAIGCFTAAMPNFIFPVQLEEAMHENGTLVEADQFLKSLNFTKQHDLDFSTFKKTSFVYCDEFSVQFKRHSSKQKCQMRTSMMKGNEWAFNIVLIAVTLFGIGRSVPWTVGTPLIDDAVQRKSAPYYFAVLRSTRLMGPLAGSWLAAGCFKLYVTLKKPVGLTPLDPQWIGAWWLGFLIIGSLLFIPSTVMLFFPDRKFVKNYGTPSEKNLQQLDQQPQATLAPENSDTSSENETWAKFKAEIHDFFESLKCCLKSKVYVFLLLERIFTAFAHRGVYSFTPKFIENHYGVPQHEVNFFLGVVSTLSYGGGILAGGVIMKRLKLEGRKAVAYTIGCSIISVLITCIRMTLGCQSTAAHLADKLINENAGLTINDTCSQGCNCPDTHVYPVCDLAGQVYFSPCHAGCTNYTTTSADDVIFRSCSCAQGGDEVSKLFCTSDCMVPLFTYYGLSVISGIIAGTANIPGMLLSLRAVPHNVRAVSLAFSIFVTSLISSAPSTIVVGKVIDSTCLLWNKICGTRGACLIYDARAFRINLHLISAVLRSIGILFELGAWYWAAGLRTLSPDEERRRRSVALSTSP